MRQRARRGVGTRLFGACPKFRRLSRPERPLPSQSADNWSVTPVSISDRKLIRFGNATSSRYSWHRQGAALWAVNTPFKQQYAGCLPAFVRSTPPPFSDGNAPWPIKR